MRSIWEDLRFALRQSKSSPGFAGAAVIALALGIGANTAIFSLVSGVLLRPLPYPEADRLVMVWGKNPRIGLEAASLPDYLDWRAQCPAFEELAALYSRSINLTGEGEAERLRQYTVSGNYFKTLGVRALAGRVLSPADSERSGPNVVVLAEGFFRRKFGVGTTVVGRTLVLDGQPRVVVGVAPATALGAEKPDVYLPARILGSKMARRADFLTVVGRLKPGISVAAAQGAMDVVTSRLTKQYPESNTDWSSEVVPLHDSLVRQVKPALLVLLGAVGFVLLIACVNVGNLLLVRSSQRQREVAVRLALGASTRRIVRQLLTECLALGLAGGVVGLVLAVWMKDALLSLAGQDTPMLDRVAIDAKVLLFTFCVSVLTSLLFGVFPAWRATRCELNESLKESGGRAFASANQWLLDALAIAEVALAVVLVAGAGLMLRSLERLGGVDLGFQPKGLLTFRVTAAGDAYEKAAPVTQFFTNLTSRLAALPGVQSVSATDGFPMTGDGAYLTLEFEGRPAPAPG